jgi:hypothetical protein
MMDRDFAAVYFVQHTFWLINNGLEALIDSILISTSSALSFNRFDRQKRNAL